MAELWSFSSSFVFIIILFIIIYALLNGITTLININNIKKDWGNNRCNPLIMPFASLFGFNTVENFNFCMGKIFNTHSQSTFGSVSTMFSGFTKVLQTIFNSIGSLRTTIATLGGGINVIFQEFTDRITNFFFKLRLSAIRMKMLFGRIYATLFSVMYMGMSGITGMSSFTNTYLFSFLDTFCFPGNTALHVLDKNTNKTKSIAIKFVKIGDILMPGNATVTATFSFYSKGQPMVRIGSTVVSTNHYIIYKGRAIKAEQHPHAVPIGGWDSDDYLYCLNTNKNIIPVHLLTFLDYDETSKGDQLTMRYVESRINATPFLNKKYVFKEYGFGISKFTGIKTEKGIVLASDIKIGDKLNNGSIIIGTIHREMNEICYLEDGTVITPSTLYWNSKNWVRFGEKRAFINKKHEMISFVSAPSSQIELENGIIVRDYMELCSPDAEMYYSKYIEMNE